jgi:hypothetical protein
MYGTRFRRGETAGEPRETRRHRTTTGISTFAVRWDAVESDIRGDTFHQQLLNLCGSLRLCQLVSSPEEGDTPTND